MGGIERRAKVPTVSEWNTSNYSRVRIATEKIIIYILPSQMAISPSTCGFFSAGVPYRPQSDMYTQCGFTNREANRAPKRYCIWNRIDPNTEIAQTLLVGRKRECKVFWCVYLFLLRFFLSRFFCIVRSSQSGLASIGDFRSWRLRFACANFHIRYGWMLEMHSMELVWGNIYNLIF